MLPNMCNARAARSCQMGEYEKGGDEFDWVTDLAMFL